MGKNKKHKQTSPTAPGMNYLDRKREREQKLLEIGMDEGTQRAFDFFSMVLHDKEVMGRDTFGLARIEKIRQAALAKDAEYADAFNTSVEADYLQEKMDAELREIYGDKLVPFRERHPAIMMPGYQKARKGWK